MKQGRRPWDGIVPPEEQELYRLAGFGTPVGMGSRPALLVIDVQYRTVGDAPKPVREAIGQYPTSCGEEGWRAIPRIAQLLAYFRGRGWPVIFPYVAPKSDNDASQFSDKVPGVMAIPTEGYAFVREVAPEARDIRIPKFHASAFAGTALASYLVRLHVDSLVFTGCTTSGCVRASVVDACSLNYKAVVPEDATYDRSKVSHAVNLFDMASKYADVMPVQDVIRALNRISARG